MSEVWWREAGATQDLRWAVPIPDEEEPKQAAPFNEFEDWASKGEPELVEHEFVDLNNSPTSKRNWPYIVSACIVVAVVYAMFVHSPSDSNNAATAMAPSPLGWTALIPCSDTTSLDGTKTLTLRDDQRAIAKEVEDGKDRTIEGQRSFDEHSQRYAVIMPGSRGAIPSSRYRPRRRTSAC